MFDITNIPKAAISIVLIYLILFILNKTICKNKLIEWGCQKSFHNMKRKEWYRLFTGSFFHANILHLLGNAFAMYFVGIILENKIGSGYFLIIYIIGNIAESLVSANCFYYTCGYGASPGIYALIGCTLILYLHNPNLLNLNYNEISCNYTIMYFFLGNLIGVTGLVAHAVGFSIGIIVSMILLLIGLI